MTGIGIASYRSVKPLLWLVALGIFMQMLDSTIVNTALPAMARSLGESPLRMQSVVVAYVLSVAMFIPASGWIADRFGTRWTYLAAILLFTLGSLGCAVSQSVGQLVAGRVVQGMGGAMLLPVGRLAVMRTVSRESFLRAMSFVTIPALIGPLIGPALGGWLVDYASWHWIFLINLPIGVIAAAATCRWMPDHRGSERVGFDMPGYLLLAVGMVSVSLALDGLAELQSRRALAVLLLMLGLASLSGYALHAMRAERPLFPLGLFVVPSFRVGVLGNVFSRMGSSSMPFLVPLLLQVGLGYSPLHAGMMMIPIAAAGMAMKRGVVALISRWGYRRVLVVNTVLVGLMIISFGQIAYDQPIWLLIAQLGLFGAVNSLQFTVMNTLTLRDLPDHLASSGNSMLSMIMMLAAGFGVAVAGGLLGAFRDARGLEGALNALPAFQLVFLCVGIITLMSTAMFWQISDDQRSNQRSNAHRK